MRIAVLGTGVVGEAIGSKLISLGHQVIMGSRTANNEKAAIWAGKNGNEANHDTFAGAAKSGEIVFNCTKGTVSLEALGMAGADNLKGKVLIDLSNPLDFSKGRPPSLFVCNTNSLAEEIQKAFADVKVVKTLNTMNCRIMVNPASIGNGDHHLFICGNDAGAKDKVKHILNQFGWKTESIMDLGDITNARGMEMILPIWLRLYGTMGTSAFNFKIVK